MSDSNNLKPLNENETSLKPKKKKKKSKKIKKWIKKHKVLTILICLLLIVAIIVGGFLIKSKSSSEAVYSYIRTTTLAKGTLDNSISTTGTVESATTSSVSTSLTYTVKSVNVSVGDEVKEGDVLVTLDTADINSQIEKEEDSIDKAVENATTNYNNAKSSYSSSVTKYNNYQSTLKSAKSALTTATAPYNTAKSAIKSYESAYNTALSNYNNAGAKYVSAMADYNSAVTKFKKSSISASSLVSYANAYMKAVANYYGGVSVGTYDISDGSSSSSATSVDDKASASSSSGATSVSVTQSANDICSSVINNVASLTGTTLSIPSGSNTLLTLSSKASALQSAKTTANYNSLYSAYTTAKSAYDTANETNTQYKTAVSDAKSQMTQAKTELENASTSDNLDTLKSQLEECSLKAEQDGTVTSMNATVGSSCKDSVATISDLDNLKVSITIAEADINSASVGMNCYITSDATEDTLNGTLTQIDPTSSDSGTFGAEVSVDSKDSGLLIGMNASAQILVSSAEDVFQVPIDAVGNDDDSNGDYVYRQTGGTGVDMTFEKIYVTLGEENDYYIEISSDELSEGDVIRSSSDLTQGIETNETTSSDSSSSIFSLFGGGGSSMGGGSMDKGSMPSGNQSSSGSSSSGSSSGTPSAPPSGFGG